MLNFIKVFIYPSNLKFISDICVKDCFFTNGLRSFYVV